jgi:hypothetical protein
MQRPAFTTSFGESIASAKDLIQIGVGPRALHLNPLANVWI